MVVGIQELYQQVLPIMVFYHRKVGTSGSREERCRICRKVTESVPHILAGCEALGQTLYLARHNNALKILFFQVIRALDLVTSEVPWFSKTQPKPTYENERAMVQLWFPQPFEVSTFIKIVPKIHTRVQASTTKVVHSQLQH